MDPIWSLYKATSKKKCPFKSSLQKLVTNHLSAGLKLEITIKVLDQEKINADLYTLLVKGKGIMCYDYISDETILEETELPSKDHFYNSLRDSNISDADYEICKKVFELGNCSTLGDYLKIYNKMDVLLLADIFLTWRNSFFYIWA